MIQKIKQFKEKLYFLITNKDKKAIRNVFLIGFIVGIFELIGLALLVLMIQIFTNNQVIVNNKLFNYIYSDVLHNNTTVFIIGLSFSVFIFYAIKLIISVINAKLMAKLTANLYVDISKKLFKSYLNYYYRDFGKKNTAQINQMLVVETEHFSLMITNVIYMIIHLMIMALLYAYMFYVDWILTFGVTVSFVLLAFLYKIYLNKKLIVMGEERIDAVTGYMKFIKSTFSNYKFIKGVDNNYIYKNLSYKTSDYKKARVDMMFWSETPRLFLEFIIIVMMIGILLFIKFKYESNSELIVVVSAYALALFRMLPSLSRILYGVNVVNMYKKTLDMVHVEINCETENNKTQNIILFKDTIRLENIYFNYPESDKSSLNGIDLKIKQGDKIAIVGESGSGKSTLMDILIGLHLPTQGTFQIDNIKIDGSNIVAWRKSTSFVPQKVVLFESTVKENITFGKEYDEKLMKEVLEDVYMYDIMMEKGGLDAKIGDEISGFSGGQMQRLAFARALYQEREILFLDEATSSLDEEIEINIIDNLLQKYHEKTIIAIVHKELIAKKFDRIIQIKKGKIITN